MKVAIPLSILHNEINLFFLTTQPVIVSVVFKLKFTLNSIYKDLLEVFQMFRHIFYILIDADALLLNGGEHFLSDSVLSLFQSI